MRKKISFLSLSTILFSAIAVAQVRPAATVSLGSDSANFSQSNTNISFITPFYNTYVDTNSHDAEWVGGFFLGGNFTFNSLWSSQVGVSYYQNSAFAARGDVYQFGDSTSNNLGYTYDITSRRVLLESKWLYTIRKKFHPYIDLGVGEAFNAADNYDEHPYTSDASPMSEPFADHTSRNFTYIAGLGIDVDMGKRVRMGVGYRYVDLGKANLGTSSLQADTNILQKNSITSHEFLFQISTIC